MNPLITNVVYSCVEMRWSSPRAIFIAAGRYSAVSNDLPKDSEGGKQILNKLIDQGRIVKHPQVDLYRLKKSLTPKNEMVKFSSRIVDVTLNGNPLTSFKCTTNEEGHKKLQNVIKNNLPRGVKDKLLKPILAYRKGKLRKISLETLHKSAAPVCPSASLPIIP